MAGSFRPRCWGNVEETWQWARRRSTAASRGSYNLERPSPMAFCQRGPPSKGSTATRCQLGSKHPEHIQPTASAEHGHGRFGMQMIALRGSTPERRVTNMKVMFKMGAGSGAAGEDPRRKSGSFRDPAARRGVGVTERTASSPQGGFTCS